MRQGNSEWKKQLARGALALTSSFILITTHFRWAVKMTGQRSAIPIWRTFPALLLIASVVLPTVFQPVSASTETIRVKAKIDGRSQLILRANTAQWHHFEFAPPGMWGGPAPTTINGVDWFAIWPPQGCNDCFSDIFKGVVPMLPQMDTTISLTVIEGRGETSIVQYPAADNGYTLIIQFDDNPISEAVWYVAEITITLPTTPFASFDPSLTTKFGPNPGDDSLRLNSHFKLAANSNGITPLTEAVTLQIGNFSKTIPAGSFQADGAGFKYWNQEEQFGAWIKPAHGQGKSSSDAQANCTRLQGTYLFNAVGNAIDINGMATPPEVNLVIGDDQGITVLDTGKAWFGKAKNSGQSDVGTQGSIGGATHNEAHPPAF